MTPAPYETAPETSDALFIVKVGPIATEKDGIVDAYLPVLPDGRIDEPEISDSALAALAFIAERAKSLGLRVECPEELGLVAKKLLISTARTPKAAYEAMICFALASAIPPEVGTLNVAPEDAVELGRLARRLYEGAPWEHCSTQPVEVRLYAPDGKSERFAVSIMGQMGEVHGFAMYDEATFAAIGAGTIAPRDVTGISLTLDAAPDAAVGAFRAAFAIPLFPMPARAERGRLVPAKTEELYKLITVGRAIAELTPKKRIARAELEFENGKMVADVEAPPPRKKKRKIVGK